MKKPWLKFYEQEVPKTIDIPDLTLLDVFRDAVETHPNGVAIRYFGKTLTYGQVGSLVSQFAVALHRLGISPGDRVALMLPNIPQYVVFHFAILQVGAVIVPTNPLYVGREVKYQLNNSGAKAIVTLDRFFPTIKDVWAETGLENVILTKAQHYLPLPLKWLYPLKARKAGAFVKVARQPRVHFYEELESEQFPIDPPDHEIKSSDVAILLYTGGTTGVSKGAVLTHRNLVSNVVQIKSWYVGVEEKKEIILSALPFFHSYGLTTCLHKAVFLKSQMVLVPNPRDIKTLLKAIEKEKATLFPGVPTLFVAINNFPGVEKYDLSSIKGCISGGAALPVQVARQFERISGGKLVEGYGLSETSPVTHANPLHGGRKEGSVGMPLPNTDAAVVDPTSKKPVAVGEVGEMAVKGPQVMQGYWQMDEETKLVLHEGWLYTGDVARMDEDGYFYIVDRKKDMIIAGGFNIYPREIEEVLFECPQILEAAVIGVPDEYRGETVKAFVVLKEGEHLTEEEVTSYCRARLAAFKVPRQVEFRESLPKSNIGKVLRRVLKEEDARVVDTA